MDGILKNLKIFKQPNVVVTKATMPVKESTINLLNKVQEMQDKVSTEDKSKRLSEIAVKEDDKDASPKGAEYLGSSGADTFYVNKEVGENGIISKFEVIDSGEQVIKNYDMVEGTSAVDLLFQVVNDLNLDSVSYKLLVDLDVLKTPEEEEKDQQKPEGEPEEKPAEEPAEKPAEEPAEEGEPEGDEDKDDEGEQPSEGVVPAGTPDASDDKDMQDLLEKYGLKEAAAPENDGQPATNAPDDKVGEKFEQGTTGKTPEPKPEDLENKDIVKEGDKAVKDDKEEKSEPAAPHANEAANKPEPAPSPNPSNANEAAGEVNTNQNPKKEGEVNVNNQKPGAEGQVKTNTTTPETPVNQKKDPDKDDMNDGSSSAPNLNKDNTSAAPKDTKPVHRGASSIDTAKSPDPKLDDMSKVANNTAPVKQGDSSINKDKNDAVKDPNLKKEDVKKVGGANESTDPVNETIKKEGDKYVVVAHSGRKMGTYGTKEEAEKRLAQIEKFKHMKESKDVKKDYEAYTAYFKNSPLTFEAWFESRLCCEDWEKMPKGWTNEALDTFACVLAKKVKFNFENFVGTCKMRLKEKVKDLDAFCEALANKYVKGASINEKLASGVKLWLVRDASKDSELADVLWEITSAVNFANLVKGGPSDAAEVEHWMIFTEEQAAKEEAEKRLSAVKEGVVPAGTPDASDDKDMKDLLEKEGKK